MDFCREESIPYGPGRGSIGGCLTGYALGIHEVDSLEHGLIFERFLTEDRVSYPDVDIDISQAERGRVIQFVRDQYQKDGTLVLQVGAFQRAGGHSVIGHVLKAMREQQPDTAESTAYTLKNYLPEGNITGGVKVQRELAFWLDGRGGYGDYEQFKKLAKDSGWLPYLLKLDGMYTNLARHAAGVVILDKKDLEMLPLAAVKDPDDKDKDIQVTAFDMYDLDDLGILKYDLLGLRTLDVIAEADKFAGGTGNMRDIFEIWRQHRDDPEPYKLLQEADTLGIFQMETPGYQRTVKEFEPTKFEHIVHLNALYRPGALDYKRPDGKNMVEVFIDRRHGKEGATPPVPQLKELLSETYGIFLYQEQAMQAVQIMAGFSASQADELRKGIGKKRRELIDALKPLYDEGCAKNGFNTTVSEAVWENINAAARYSWNKSHSVEYGLITWLTVWYKYHHPAAFYAALANSLRKDKGDKLPDALAEARQRVPIMPPDINVAGEGFTVTEKNGEPSIVFGLSGIKGLGDATREEIVAERIIPYGSFQDFALRLPSIGSDKKLALIRCGAFDQIDDRAYLLAVAKKPGKSEKTWTVAEALNHNRTLKNPRPAPPVWEVAMPSAQELSQGELDTIGYYVSEAPLADVAAALKRVDSTNHWGGEVAAIYKKTDKRNQLMAHATLLTPSLQKQRITIFSSVWEGVSWIEKGMHVIIRGRRDGNSVLVDAVFQVDDVRHFKKIRIRDPEHDTVSVEDFDGSLNTVLAMEDAGYEVSLL